MHPDRPTPPDEMFAMAENIEKMGFDSLWIGDHIAFHGGYFSESLTTLAAFAARTSRLMIGSAVYLLPLRRPGVAAKIAATVDYLSGGGRFVFGVGVGGEGKEEFELCGVPVKERGARTDESIEIIRKLWSGKKGESPRALLAVRRGAPAARAAHAGRSAHLDWRAQQGGAKARSSSGRWVCVLPFYGRAFRRGHEANPRMGG